MSRPTVGPWPLSGAQRQERHRARHKAAQAAPPAPAPDTQAPAPVKPKRNRTRSPTRIQGDPEQRARAINAQPWEPLPGMVKRRCLECEFWVAFDKRDRRPAICPDCRFLQVTGKSYGGRHVPSG